MRPNVRGSKGSGISAPLRVGGLAALLLLAAFLAFDSTQDAAYASTFTVNTTADTVDATPGNGICADAGGFCSLRAAIMEANAFAGTDDISFSIAGAGVQIIAPATPLPVVTTTVVIDGTTQPGATCGAADFSGRNLLIELSGTVSTGSGLDFNGAGSGGSTVKGLAIGGFGGAGMKGILVRNGSSGNTIVCNNIGTHADGTGANPNGQGVAVIGGGGANTIRGNVISGNTNQGVFVGPSTGTVIAGNRIGTTVNGLSSLKNGIAALTALNSTDTTIGGTAGLTPGGACTGDCNLISGNNPLATGIAINGTASGAKIQGNFIGTNVNGTLALDNSGDGIHINTPDNLLIEGNLVSGNSEGISRDTGILTSTVVIRANKVGTDTTGALGIPNRASGIAIHSGTGGIIGGALPADANIVAFNGRAGIGVDGAGTSIEIRGNSVFSNTGLGIDLGGSFAGGNSVPDGVTANDALDADSGPNGFQNFPVILGSPVAGASVSGMLNSAPSASFRIELFASPTCDPSGFGEGQTSLGSVTATTDGSGAAPWSVVPVAATTAGQRLTATATNTSTRETSEFSACATVFASGAQTYTVRNVNDSGANSLRQAILDANASAVADTIAFNIPVAGVQTISLLSPLPDVTAPVSIDGATQPGTTCGPVRTLLVVLDGAGAGGGNGLWIGVGAGGSSVRGLSIVNWGNYGIALIAPGNTMSCSNIGVRADGQTAGPNGAGVGVFANGNTIGGVTVADRNIISGNGQGIYATAASGNTISGNYIGVAADGVTAVPNLNGIVLANASNGNTIGGDTTPGACTGGCNIVAGNQTEIALTTASDGNTVSGNFVGLNALGNAAGPGPGYGILLGGASNNTIGGATPSRRNIVGGKASFGIVIVGPASSGNRVIGNYVGVSQDGMSARPNNSGIVLDAASGNTVGGPTAADRNISSGNHLHGIVLQNGSSANTIAGNYFGVGADGATAIPNVFDGVNLGAASAGNTIGGTLPGAGNVISGNGRAGILLADATNNAIQGNRIGTNAVGTAAVANIGNGVQVQQNTSITQIGGFGAAARNIISGNGEQGILVNGPTNTGVSIQGNYIGLAANGTTMAPNALNGVAVADAPGVVIGGPAAAYGNVISGNAFNGVEVNGAGSTGTSIQNNYIGTDATGLLDRGNAGVGMYIINGAASSSILGNVVSGNTGLGVAFVNAGGTHAVLGNRIGVGADGTTPLGNGGSGVWVEGTARVVLGGFGVVGGNVIAFNGADGVSIRTTSAYVSVTENSIHENTGPGIVNNTTGGGTPAPLLSGATAGSGAITGIQTSPPLAGQSFRIHYYSNPTCADPEGRSYLGFKDIITGIGGSAPVDAVLNSVLSAGEGVTATATDTSATLTPPGSTSAFSNCVTAAGQSVLSVTAGFTTSTPAVPPAAYAVPISSIPIASLTSLPKLVTSAPLDSVTIKGTPLDSVPLDSVPLDSVRINGVPLDSVPLDSVPLDSVPLDSVPLDSVAGWLGYLEGTPLAGLPTNALTLADVRTYAPAKLHALTLANVSLLGTLLKNASLASIALGAAPLDSVGVSPLAPLPVGVTICGLISCADKRTLLSAEISPSPLDSVPLDSVPLDSVPLDSVPLDSVAFLKAAAIGALPLDSVPLDSVPLDSVSIGDAIRVKIGLASIPLDSVPLDSVPLDSVRLRQSGLTLCEYLAISGIGCAGLGVNGSSSILQLVQAMERAGIDPASSPLDSVPLDSVPLDSVPLLGRTLGYFYGQATFGEVQARGGSFGGLTLGQLLVAMLKKTDYPWEQLPLDELGVARFAFSGTPVEYDLNFTVTGGTPGFVAEVVVNLPSRFAYIASSPGFPTSSSLTPGTDPAVAVPSPVIVGSQLRWSLAGLSNSTQYVLHFRANPGLIPAITSTSATVSVGTDVGVTAPLLVTVTEAGEPSNDNPLSLSLTTILPDTLYLTQIGSATDVDYFKVPAPAVKGSRVGVFLSHLGSDADIFVYGPVVPNLAPSPRPIPLQSDPVTDEGAGGVADGQQLAPQAPSSTAIASLALRGVSVNRGTGPESVETFATGDPYTIRVAGYNGASSQQPYVLRVKVTPPPLTPTCPARTFRYAGPAQTGLVTPSAITGLNTLFIVNWKRLGDAYGPGAAASVHASVDAVVAANIPHAKAVVVPVDSLPAFNAYDLTPCDPDKANNVVQAITAVIASWHALNPALTNIVIVGSDELIPMARVPDVTRLSNERDYANTLADRKGALWAAHVSGDLLTDDPYGDFDPIPWLNRYLYVPEMAVGRLVETPTEIKAALDVFVARQGFIDPRSGLSTGYDFLSDGALAVQAALQGQPWAAPAAVGPLISEAWTASDLAGVLLPSGASPDVVSLNSHFNHWEALPAAQNSIGTTNDLFESGRLIGPSVDGRLLSRIIFSMGCHAGLSVIQALFDGGAEDPGRDLALVLEPRARDWPEVFARQGAIFIGNTGYGYGDTASVALSEKLMLRFARELDGKVTVGEALWRAKQTYFSELGLYGVYDEKALMEATFYGLPMYRIGTPTPTPPSRAPAPLRLPTPSIDPVSTLAAVSVTIAVPAFHELPLSGNGRVLEPDSAAIAPLGGTAFLAEVGTQVTHYRPIEPRLSFDVTRPDQFAHGVLITALTSTDVTSFDPVFSVPVIDTSDGAPEPKFDDTAFPSSFQNVTTYSARDGIRADGLRQNAVIIPGQYFAHSAQPGTQRTFNSIGSLVYYAPNAGTDFQPPVFARTDALLVSGQVWFTVEVIDDLSGAPGAGTGAVRRVLALVHNGSSTWLAVELRYDGGSRWSAVAGVSGTNIEYFVQAVDASGNVATSINKGVYFPALPAQPPVASGVTVAPHGDLSGGAYVSAVRVSVAGPSTYRYSVDDGPFLPVGPTMEFTVGLSGPHHVRVQGADGSFASLQFVIAPAAPSVTLVSPKEGAYYATGQQKKASYTCGGGLQITSCVGTVATGARIATATPGDKTFTVTATDVANRTAQVTVTYHVMDACLIPPTISGTSGSNTLTGTSGDDVIHGNGGNDTINGNGGDDIICAGAGNDTITTGSGDDFIVAAGGNNKVVAGSGDNVIIAGDGNDSITSGSGADIIVAGNGNNSVIAGDGSNTVSAGSGNDLITTGSGDDIITAGEGNNDVTAGDGNNSVTAGAGNDQITTGSGNDTISAGAGNNKVSAGAGNDTIAAGAGNDKIDGGPGDDTCSPGGGNNTVTNCAP